MTRDTEPSEISPAVVPLDDANEVQDFYKRQRLHFWTPRMLSFGHAFGIRSDGELVSAAGVNFVLGRHSYAQIGSIATDARYRGRGIASACIHAAVSSLHHAGIVRCGLFANSDDELLLAFYAKRGFRDSGCYHFIEH